MVGGFSICSSPRLLEQERMIELAVKHTSHPPALWIHNQVSKPLFKLGDLGSLPLTKFSSLNPPKEPRLGCKGYTLAGSALPSRIRFQKRYRSSIFVYFLLSGRATWRVGSQLANQGQNLHPTQWGPPGATKEAPKKQGRVGALKDDAEIPWGRETPPGSPGGIQWDPAIELRHFTLYVSC